MYSHSSAVKHLFQHVMGVTLFQIVCFSLSFYVPVWKVSAIVSIDLNLLYL
jgi:hypothetical protein